MHRLGRCSCASHYRWFDKGASARREHPLIGAHGSENRVRPYPMRSMCDSFSLAKRHCLSRTSHIGPSVPRPERSSLSANEALPSFANIAPNWPGNGPSSTINSTTNSTYRVRESHREIYATRS
jgi:hypothetical protein